MTGTYDMKGRRVVVTGAGRGIGRGIALEFARAGASVVVHYSSTATGAQEVVDEIKGIGGKATAIQADLVDIADIEKLAAASVEFLDGCDVLVNNAGITLTKKFEETTPREYDNIYNVNLRAMFFLIQKLLPELEKDGGGHVINITSIHAYSGMPEHSVYAGTKGAIVAFTRTLGLELSKRGIRINAIAPGWILIEKHVEQIPEGFDWDAAAGLIPAGFIGQPTDAGKLCLFLASAESRYIIGQTIMLDGGQSIVMPLAAQVTELFGDQPPSYKPNQKD
jgi:NAD(P)-dependent dehydrogenase (short-subunit alcohol dehydrogenase family)